MCGGGGYTPLPKPEEKEIDFGPLPSLRVSEESGNRSTPEYRDVERPEPPRRARRVGSQRRSLFNTGQGLIRYD